MATRSAASWVIAMSVLAACSSFGDSPGSSGSGGDAGSDAGTEEGGTSSGAPDGEVDSAPKSGCAAFPKFLFCSDFDQSTEVSQPTKPNGTPWLVGQDQNTTLTVGPVPPAFSLPNALTSAGNGATAPFKAQVRAQGLPFTKNKLRLRMALRVGNLPTPSDAFFAAIQFSNIQFTAVMHADGRLDLGQAVPFDAQPIKANITTDPATSTAWSILELTVDRTAGIGRARIDLNGTGGDAALSQVPAGDAAITVGIGYCDVPCGTPSLSFDDVVLTEE